MSYYNRRQFLARSSVGVLGATLALSNIASSPALASTTGGYKAVVTIMLKGGLDHSDTLLPTDQASYDQLREVRGDILDGYGNEESSSRARANILGLNVRNAADFGTRRFGLPRDMPSLHAMFNRGEAAVIGSVGPLLEPTTRDDFEFNRVALPNHLFSHNDQQSTWMALDVEGAPFGWGGLMADCAIRAGGGGAEGTHAAVAANTTDVFLAGRTARPFRLPTIGRAAQLKTDSLSNYIGRHRRGDGDAAREALNRYLRRDASEHNTPFRRDVVGAKSRGVSEQTEYSALAETGTLDVSGFPATKLGQQLAAIALAMSLRGQLGTQRQVFYADIGGFDSHDNHAASLPGRQSELDGALGAFRDSLLAQGLWNDTLVITVSDFGRSLVGNGKGTDHGWGGHQYVMGGAVRGGRIYGDVIPPDPAHAQYTNRRARMIPTTSIEQFAAPIAGWFGLNPDEVADVFPNLSRFEAGTMGFV